VTTISFFLLPSNIRGIFHHPLGKRGSEDKWTTTCKDLHGKFIKRPQTFLGRGKMSRAKSARSELWGKGVRGKNESSLGGGGKRGPWEGERGQDLQRAHLISGEETSEQMNERESAEDCGGDLGETRGKGWNITLGGVEGF